MQSLAPMQRLAARRVPVNGRMAKRALNKVSAVLAVEPAVKAGVKVTVKVTHKVRVGEVVGIVGTAESIGAWVPANALKMTWNTGDVWSTTFDVDEDTPTLEYKYVVINNRNQVIAWSKDPNRRLEVGTLMGSSITVSEQWEAGPREIRLVVSGLGMGADSPGIPVLPGIRSGLVPIPAMLDMTPEHQQTFLSVQNQLKEITERLPEFEELRQDVARLVAAGPLPPWVSAKQLTDLTQQLSVFEDLVDVVSDLADISPMQAKLSKEQLESISDKLARYGDVEESLTDMVSQLSSRGGCPVGYAVGKSIAHAARHPVPRHHRPWNH